MDKLFAQAIDAVNENNGQHLRRILEDDDDQSIYRKLEQQYETVRIWKGLLESFKAIVIHTFIDEIAELSSLEEDEKQESELIHVPDDEEEIKKLRDENLRLKRLLDANDDESKKIAAKHQAEVEHLLKKIAIITRQTK